MADLYKQLAEHCNELQAKLDGLQAVIQRLQTMQAEDVTLEELEAVNDELPDAFVSNDTIAAVCRGMLREGGGDG